MAAQVSASAAQSPRVPSATDLYMSTVWEPEHDSVPEAEQQGVPLPEPALEAGPGLGAAAAASVPATFDVATAYGDGPPSYVAGGWEQYSYAPSGPLPTCDEAPAVAPYADPYAPQQGSEQGTEDQAWQSWYAHAPADANSLAQQWAAWYAAQAQPAPTAGEDMADAAPCEQVAETGLPPGVEAAPVGQAAVPDQAAAWQVPTQSDSKEDGAADASGCHAGPHQLEGASGEGGALLKSSAEPTAEPQRKPRATLLVEGASVLLGAYGNSEDGDDSSASGAGAADPTCSDAAMHSSDAGKQGAAEEVESPEGRGSEHAVDWEQDPRLAAARFLDELRAPSLGPVTPSEELWRPPATARSRSASEERMAALGKASHPEDAHGSDAAAAEPAEADAGGRGAMQAPPEAQHGDEDLLTAGAALLAAGPDSSMASIHVQCSSAEQHAGRSNIARQQQQPETEARERCEDDRTTRLERHRPDSDRPSRAEAKRLMCLGAVTGAAQQVLGTVADCAAQLSADALLQLAALSHNYQIKVCGHAMLQRLAQEWMCLA